MRQICGIIPPRMEQILLGYIVDDDNYLPECILSKNHNSPHRFQLPNGKQIEWEDDYTCDCCDGDTEDRCIIYGEVK